MNKILGTVQQAIDIEKFDYTSSENLDITLSQNTGLPENYKLLQFDIEDAYNFVNFNISYAGQQNYSFDITFELFTSIMTPSIDSQTELFGNQNLNGSVYAFPQNNTQLITFFTSAINTSKYIRSIAENKKIKRKGFNIDGDIFSIFKQNSTYEIFNGDGDSLIVTIDDLTHIVTITTTPNF